MLEKNYFINDPANEGMIFFETEEERDKFAPSVVYAYLDGGWSEEVEHITKGVITHRCQQTNRHERPPEDEIDEDGNDQDGKWWDADWLYTCNYELIAVNDELTALRELRNQVRRWRCSPILDDDYLDIVQEVCLAHERAMQFVEA